MKKLIVLLSFIILFPFIGNSINPLFKANYFSIKSEQCGWSQWLKSNVLIDVELKKKFIVIYSNQIQIYVIRNIISKDIKDGHVYVCECKDDNLNDVLITLYSYNNNNHYLVIDNDNEQFIYNINILKTHDQN